MKIIFFNTKHLLSKYILLFLKIKKIELVGHNSYPTINILYCLNKSEIILVNIDTQIGIYTQLKY